MEVLSLYTYKSEIYSPMVCIPFDMPQYRITQVVQDQVCVVTSSDKSSCVNQDVLFLGLGELASCIILLIALEVREFVVNNTRA